MDFLNLDFLSNISESQLGVGGIAVLVLSMILGVIKGVIRIILGLAGLAAAAVAGWFSFQHGDSIANAFVEQPEPWMPIGIAGGAAASAYLAVRHGAGLVLSPIIGSVDALKKKKGLAAMLGLGMGGAGLYGGGTVAHQVDARTFLDDQRKGESVSWVTKVLSKTEGTWFGTFQEKTDPTQTGFKCDLVKVLSLAKFSKENVASPEAQSLINSPEVQHLLNNKNVANALEGGDFQSLFSNDELSHFLTDPENRELLQQLDWKDIVSY